jgi:4-amino-4-deoxy-L-arabinose transferase-like glycosyltransferase
MTETIMWALSSASIGILLFLVCILLGTKIQKLLRIQSNKEENIVFSIGLGIGTMGLILFALGLAELYTKTAMITATIILLSLCIKEIPQITSSIKAVIKSFRETSNKGIYKALLYTNLLFSTLILLVALSPETEWDAISYHLATPKIYAMNEALVPIYYAWHTAPPHLLNMLYVVGEIFQSDVTSRVFIALMNLTLVLGVFLFGKRYFSEKTGLFAATILLATPILLVYFSSTYVDLPLGLFVLLAVWSFWLWKESNQMKYLFLTALFCGFAITTKLVVAPVIPILGIAYWYYAYQKKTPFTSVMTKTIVIGCIIAILLMPWLTFNYVHFDNPIYPWAEGIFEGRYWNSDLTNFWSTARDDYLNGTEFTQFLLLPITFTYMPNVSGPIYGFTPFFFAFIPLLFLYQWKRKTKSILSFICFFAIANIIVWFIAAPDWRYIFYILPFLALLTAHAITTIFEDQQCSMITKRIIAASIILIIISSLFFFFVIFRLDIQLWTNEVTREEFKAHDTQNYWVAQYINKNLAEDAVLFLGYDDKTYYFDRVTIVGNGEFSTYVDYTNMEDGDAFYTRLEELGVTHVVITQNENGIVPGTYQQEHILQLYNDLISNYLEPIFEKNGSTLYELI